MGEEARHVPVGRAAEAATLSRFAAGLCHGSAAVLVRGEPGIGKTTLWRHAVAAAEASGVLVLAVGCVEAEMPIGMCSLSDLLEPVLGDLLDRLPAPQREALRAAVGLETGAHRLADRIALPRAVTTALWVLTERTPVLVAVDDAQWLDPASRRLVAFALRRLVARPLGALVTLRTAAPESDPLALESAFGHQRFEEICLGPLSQGALSQLLRSSLDVHVPRPVLKRIHEVSGGNPMYALELLRSMSEAGETLSLAPMTLPASLDELMRARIVRLPPEIRALLETVAALERPTLALLRRALDDAPALLDHAISAEALLVDDDGLVRFTHPLLASAVYTRVPPSRRRKLHARLAALIEAPEERAGHLALAVVGTDPEVAKALDDAARRAALRGAPDVAAVLVEHARRLTPAGDPVAAAERVLAEAGYLADTAEQGRARTIVDELLATPVAGPLRARALQLRFAFSPPPNFDDSLALLEHALEHTGDDRRLHVRLLSWLAYALGYVGDYVAAEERAREAVALAGGLGDTPLTGLAVDILFNITSVRGTPRPAAFAHLLGLERSGQLTGEIAPHVILSRERRCAGDLGAARGLLEQELAACDRRGTQFARATLLCELADVELRAGNWQLAGACLDEALGVQRDGEDFFGQVVTRSAQGLLAAYRGDVGEARRLARDSIAVAQEWGWEEFVARNRWILGLVELSVGEPREAWRMLEGLPETLRRIGIGEPGHLPALPDVVETLVALGRLEEGAAVVGELEAQARALEHRWATPAALRCRALLSLARGEAEAALKLADRAADAFETASFPFDRGRSLLAAGDALRRLGQRRRAAERLEQAHDIFGDLGARVWRDRAGTELRRAAPRRGNNRELTEAERRVAALVAAGRTNREVAAELFTSISTVEAHLTRIYRKLDVRSRTELARRASDIP